MDATKPRGRRLTLADCQQSARNKKGECLDTKYKNCATKMHWRCYKKHEWKATYNSILHQNSWCKECLKHTIEECREEAEKREGKCLSEIYVRTGDKLLWECKKGHQWEATFNNISRDHWCPRCNHGSEELIDLQAKAKEKEGWCLDLDYTIGDRKYNWRCKKGHEWLTTWFSVKDGSWCRLCLNESLSHGVEACNKTAADREGLFLSTSYRNAHDLYEW